MENNFVWDEDKLNKLRKLWDEGLPITKIGNEIGVSRNAIAGKAHRMGLPKRNSPISKSGDPRKNQLSNNSENSTNEYVVKQGDTLWDIANNHKGVSVTIIKQLNNLSDNNLIPGTKILLPRI